MNSKNSNGWKKGRTAKPNTWRATLRQGRNSPSRLEAKWALVWRAVGGPALVTEHAFAPPRKWRLDFAHPESKVAVEIHGGTWSGGRHVRGQGMANDCQKMNAAALAGWTVFTFTAEMITLKSAEMVRDVIRARIVGVDAARLPDGDRRFILQANSLLGDPVNARIAASFRAGLFSLGYNLTDGGSSVVTQND